MRTPAAAHEGAFAREEQMRPYSFFTIGSMSARVRYTAPSSTTPLTASQSCAVSSVNGLCGRMAALLIRMSTRPNSDSARAAIAST